MKMAALSAAGLQIGLKVIIGGSMQFLWGLMNALQVFQWVICLNIKFPPNLPAFVAYFALANGDPSTIGIKLPEITEWLIDVDDINGQYDNEIMSPAFVEQEMSPYFIIAYSSQLSMWIFGIFLVLPVLLVLVRMCKKIKMFEEMVGTFFYNGPLRTLTQMYFQMMIQILVNTSFIKFRNKS